MRCHVCDSVSVPPPAPLSHPLHRISCLPLSPFCLRSSPFCAPRIFRRLSSCPFFVSASLLSAPSPASSSSPKLGLLGHQYFRWGVGEPVWKWVGGAPSMPGNYFSHLLLPRVTIHIYEIERTWGYKDVGIWVAREMLPLLQELGPRDA